MLAHRIIGARDRTERVQLVVRETVRLLRGGDLKMQHAIESAAAVLGISTRRVRAHYKQELTRICVTEDYAVLDGFLRLLDRKADLLRAWADDLARQRQLLEMSGLCADGSPRYSAGGTSAPSDARSAALTAASAALEKARARQAAFDAALARARP